MTAKEMFKKIKLNCYDVSYIDNEIVEVLYYNDNDTVDISKKGITYTENGNKKPLPLYFLPAVNKQLEELGWNK